MKSELKGCVQGPENSREASSACSSITPPAEPKCGSGLNLADDDKILEMEEHETWMPE